MTPVLPLERALDRTDSESFSFPKDHVYRSGVRGRAVLAAALVLACVLSLSQGAVALAPSQVTAILLTRLGIHLDVSFTGQHEAVLLAIRLPRLLLGVLVGAGLASAGAALQAIFRNPLADPALVGVSSGAALGAVAAIVFGLASSTGLWSLPLAAFIGGLSATLAIYRFARRDGRTEVTTLLLAGLATNALLGAVIGLIIQRATDPQLRSIVFWQLGSLGSATWSSVLVAWPFLLGACVLLQRQARQLNLLLLGEAEAFHLGLDTERLKLQAVALAALATGTAVAVAGIIGFVGLIVPHLVRLLVGPDHRRLLPLSALGGALLLVLADLGARTIVQPAEISLGVVTAFLGAPFFLYLIERSRRAQGAWT
jgi:iron complex transport system permease protein